ncbi:MAG: TiaS agmantine-binding domain-containing protein [Nitrososphaera sp.]
MPREMLHIAFDDTDSRTGRCTTHLAFRVVEHLKKMDAELVDNPLLIRLNPNIPWKTRGNGAVCLRARVRDPGRVVDYVRQTVETGSAIGCGANPGVAFLAAENIPPALRRFSAAAMCDVMSRQMAEKIADDNGITYFTYGNGQGLVGSLGAMGSLLLDTDYTYELIAYRKQENCGKERIVDKQKVIKFSEETYPNTFNNYDSKHERVLIAPHGPDPVYFGIRGENSNVVSSAIGALQPEEELDGWMVFRSNQGTNMHLQNELKIPGVKAYTAGYVRCKVASIPIAIEGGHVIFSVEQGGAQMPAAIYEPTGLANVAARLVPGDSIEIGCGTRKGTTKHPKILNVEYLHVLNVAETYETQNPLCKICGKRMKSEGKGKGYQCDRCKFKDASAIKILIPKMRDLKPRLYIPTPKAHRHLTKPLQRYGLEKNNFQIVKT